MRRCRPMRAMPPRTKRFVNVSLTSELDRCRIVSAISIDDGNGHGQGADEHASNTLPPEDPSTSGEGEHEATSRHDFNDQSGDEFKPLSARALPNSKSQHLASEPADLMPLPFRASDLASQKIDEVTSESVRGYMVKAQGQSAGEHASNTLPLEGPSTSGEGEHEATSHHDFDDQSGDEFKPLSARALPNSKSQHLASEPADLRPLPFRASDLASQKIDEVTSESDRGYMVSAISMDDGNGHGQSADEHARPILPPEGPNTSGEGENEDEFSPLWPLDIPESKSQQWPKEPADLMPLPFTPSDLAFEEIEEVTCAFAKLCTICTCCGKAKPSNAAPWQRYSAGRRAVIARHSSASASWQSVESWQ